MSFTASLLFFQDFRTNILPDPHLLPGTTISSWTIPSPHYSLQTNTRTWDRHVPPFGDHKTFPAVLINDREAITSGKHIAEKCVLACQILSLNEALVWYSSKRRSARSSFKNTYTNNPLLLNLRLLVNRIVIAHFVEKLAFLFKSSLVMLKNCSQVIN